MTSRRRPSSPLLLRVYLFGVLLLLLAGGASFLVGRYVITPAAEVPARPATAWIAWHLLEGVDDQQRIARELSDLKQRAHVEMTLRRADGGVIATNTADLPAPATALELAQLGQRGTRFGTGLGLVALRDASGRVSRYAQVRFPVPELPLGTAMAQLGVALLVIALLSIPLARSVTAPLEHLKQLSERFGSGDLSARSGLTRKDEVGELGRAFDEMAERVVSLRKAEKELLANISHELRTPLQRIRMALELVQSNANRATGYLTDIEDDLGELERLLDDVMTAARLELSRGDPLPPLRRRTVGAGELVEAARQRFETRFAERRLECHVESEAPEVDADPTLLRRVLDNLLENAAKFSDPSTTIEVRASRGSTAELQLEVRDRGIGIDKSELERIFEPFYRTDRSRARSTGGVGLGLALARRIVAAHGGSIVASCSPEQGTCFRLLVPSVTQA